MNRLLFPFILVSLLACGNKTPAGHSDNSALIDLGGLRWLVKHAPLERVGPGPMYYSRDNAYLDAQGALVLRLTGSTGPWTGGEVRTLQPLGYGAYRWTVEIPRPLDRRVVFGLFSYPEPGTGPDGTHEIDIEFAHFPAGKIVYGHYLPWGGRREAGRPLDFVGVSTHEYRWMPGRLEFRSWQAGQLVAEEIFAPVNAREVSDQAMPLHINLWLFRGVPPDDGQPLTVRVLDFTYTPWRAP